MVQVLGLSGVKPWGRWSDANLDDGVTIRVLDPLPKTLRVKLTCKAFGPNAGRPAVVEIGLVKETFTPTEL